MAESLAVKFSVMLFVANVVFPGDWIATAGNVVSIRKNRWVLFMLPFVSFTKAEMLLLPSIPVNVMFPQLPSEIFAPVALIYQQLPVPILSLIVKFSVMFALLYVALAGDVIFTAGSVLSIEDMAASRFILE